MARVMAYWLTAASQWRAAWWQQAITWTNVDLSLKMFCGIYLRAISQDELMSLIHNVLEDYTFKVITYHI